MHHRFKDIIWLASRDYRNEWQMSTFFIIALAAVLGPMMILYGLKFGIVGSMLTNLIEDPRNREVRPIGSGRYDSAWIEQLPRQGGDRLYNSAYTRHRRHHRPEE